MDIIPVETWIDDILSLLAYDEIWQFAKSAGNTYILNMILSYEFSIALSDKKIAYMLRHTDDEHLAISRMFHEACVTSNTKFIDYCYRKNMKIDLNFIAGNLGVYRMPMDIITKLMELFGVTLSGRNGYLNILETICYGRTDIFKLLMKSNINIHRTPNIDSMHKRIEELVESDFTLYTLSIAVEYCQVEIIVLLLQDPDVDPNIEDGFPFEYAVDNMSKLDDYFTIARLLLNHKKIDIHKSYDILIRSIVGNCKYYYQLHELFKIILKHDNLNVRHNNYDMISKASYYGYADIVDELLSKCKSDIITMPESPLISAVRNARIDVIMKLLKDGRFDPNCITIEYIFDGWMDNEAIAIVMMDSRYDMSHFNRYEDGVDEDIDEIRSILAKNSKAVNSHDRLTICTLLSEM